MKNIILWGFVLSLYQTYSLAGDISAVSDMKKTTAEASVSKARWYSQSYLLLGEQVYNKHCLACHKADAKGIENWKKTLSNGEYPPPPLNGTAHAWHHDISTLTRTVQQGGVPLGGVMPAFRSQLTDSEIRAVIAYFQHFWSNEIYTSWLELGGLE